MSEHSDFYQLYTEHSKMVYNLCLNYLQNTEDAEEATQDVFIKVHKKIAGFRADASLKTWIYRITITHCLDLIKAKNRQKRFGFMQSLFGKSGEEEIPQKNFNHPGVELENKEAIQELLELIQELPDNQKTALILKSIDGLPGKEIAQIMQLTEKAVESLLSRAKQNLKQKIEQTKD
jgi:RNA polymerase sigma factor (sigma-70 family)